MEPAPTAVVSIRRLVLQLLLARTVVNITRRFPYPFVPTIARQLDSPISRVQSVIALQSLVSLGSPFLGGLSDRFGRKRVLIACMLVLALGGMVGALFSAFTVFAAVMIVFGSAKMIFDPSMQAYVAERVPFQRRGAAMGAVELSWSLALVLGAPLAAVLLDASGLQALFAAIAALSLALALMLWRGLPTDKPDPQQRIPFANPIRAWGVVRKSRMALIALAYSIMLIIANEMLFIGYAAWLEASFGLSVTSLGLVAIVIAAGEVAGELAVIRFSDQMGLQGMALLAAAGAALSYGLFPLMSGALWVAMLVLGFMFFCVEIAIVASFPLFTEVLPSARAMLMSSNVAAHGVGRVLGAFIGGVALALSDDFRAVGVLALVIGMGAALLMSQIRIASEADEMPPA